MAASRGRFARICVEIDLHRPLNPKIQVLGHMQVMEYEGLHLVWFSCGQYGHKAQDCASSIDQTTAASGLESLPPQPPVRPTVAQTPETSFEPWMLVPSGRRHHRPLAGSDVGTERKAVRSQVPRDGITGDLIS